MMEISTKIIINTTNRAEYDLLSPLIDELEKDEHFHVLLAISYGHLDESRGYSLNNINDKCKKYIIRNNPKDPLENSKEFIELYNSFKPDMIVVLGDRYELIPICFNALIRKIPIVHISGGETTIGAFDNSIRNAITQMANIHFPSTDLYKNKIIQMCENSSNVHNVGSLSIDNIKKIKIKEKKEWYKEVFNKKYKKQRKIALMTYHPETLSSMPCEKQINNILYSLDIFNYDVLVTAPNNDPGGDTIFNILKEKTRRNSNKYYLYKNMGSTLYINSLCHCDFVIGNSSSGIIEASFFNKPVINIGDRQTGRLKSVNIFDIENSKDKIIKAIKNIPKKETEINNIYGDGNTSKKIVKILKTINLNNIEKLIIGG